MAGPICPFVGDCFTITCSCCTVSVSCNGFGAGGSTWCGGGGGGVWWGLVYF